MSPHASNSSKYSSMLFHLCLTRMFLFSLYAGVLQRKSLTYRHTWFYCCLQIMHLYKLKAYGNLALSKSISTIFSNSICWLHISVSHFGILAVFQTFSFIVSYGDQWSLITDSDLWCYYCFLGMPWTMPIWDGELLMCSNYFTNWPVSYLSSSSQASLFLETQQYWK